MSAPTNFVSLADAIRKAGDPLTMLRTSATGPFAFPRVPREVTNWRDEQEAWHSSCALIDMSYHQTDLFLRGPGVLDLLMQVGVNRFAGFPVGSAKQLVCAAPSGLHVTDGIVMRLEEDCYRLVGAQPVSNWVQYHAESGGWDVEVQRDENSMFRLDDRRFYAFQVQGPTAPALMAEVVDGGMPEIGFFRIGEVTIRGAAVRALRHGMAGQAGFELSGPWADFERVRDALVEAGANHGLVQVGGVVMYNLPIESGWYPFPLPAIYSGDGTQGYREWLPVMTMEGMGSMGGSYQAERIEDYYVNAVEIGYGKLIDPDRSFNGSEYLHEALKSPRRKKVTLEFDVDDVMAVHRAGLFEDPPAKYLDYPYAGYSTFPADSVQRGGRQIGLSHWTGFSVHTRKVLSLALVEIEHSAPGTEVTVLWGEPGSQRPTVENHVVREIRATVAPAPYYSKIIAKG
jgi:vanillate/3-O-methylgallate O-demethylase